MTTLSMFHTNLTDFIYVGAPEMSHSYSVATRQSATELSLLRSLLQNFRVKIKKFPHASKTDNYGIFMQKYPKTAR